MGWFRRKFLTGLLILLPILVTGWILYHFFNSIDSIIDPLIERYPFLDFPGIGFVSVILIIFLVGVFGGNLLGRKLLGFLEIIVSRIPLISRMYIAVKQISEVFLRKQKTVFKKAVLVQYPREGTFAIGFVTSTTHFADRKNEEQVFVNVFLPTTPNPTSGFFLLVPVNEVIYLECTVEEALKMVISGGAVKPEHSRFEGLRLPDWTRDNNKDK
jgi:uncharacterized membrane protein